LILDRVKSEQKPNRKGRTCTQAGARRQISNVMDLDAIVHIEVLQASPHRWVLDHIVVAYVFNFGIRDPAVILEKGW
jgi:hypothetical protein